MLKFTHYQLILELTIKSKIPIYNNIEDIDPSRILTLYNNLLKIYFDLNKKTDIEILINEIEIIVENNKGNLKKNEIANSYNTIGYFYYFSANDWVLLPNNEIRKMSDTDMIDYLESDSSATKKIILTTHETIYHICSLIMQYT